MKTYLDCIPCFFKQALESARLAGVGKRKQKMILNELAKVLPKLSLNASPPQIARVVNQLLKEITKNKDIYRPIKKKSNKLALNIYSRLKKKVRPLCVFSLTTIFQGLSGATSLVAEQARRQYSQPIQRSRSMTMPQWCGL